MQRVGFYEGHVQNVIIRLNHLGDEDSLSIKLINHKNWQSFQQRIDRTYLRQHKDLSVRFQTPLCIMKYLINNIHKIIISVYGHIRFPFEKYGISEIITIQTEEKLIGFSDRLDMKIEQLNNKFVQNEKLGLARQQQNLRRLQIQFDDKISKIQRKSKKYLACIAILILIFSVIGSIAFFKITKHHKKEQLHLLQVENVMNEKINSLYKKWNELSRQIQDQFDSRWAESQRYYQNTTRQIKLIQQQMLNFNSFSNHQTQQSKLRMLLSEQYQQMNYGHHPHNPHKQHFSLHKNKNSLIVRHASESNWYNFINNYEIKIGQKISYQINIKKLTSNYMYVGFGTKTTFGIALISKSQTIFYHCGGGMFEGGVYKSTNKYSQSGDVLSISVDLKGNKIVWFKNNFEFIAESSVPIKMQNKSLYLIVYFRTRGDQIQFSAHP